MSKPERTTSWLENQHDMLQQHIRICWEGVEKKSKEEIISEMDNC